MNIRLTRTVPVMAALVLVAVASPVLAHATTGTPGVVDAYNAGHLIQTQLNSGNIAEPAQKALNILVARGIANLAAAGETTLADQLDREWNSGFVDYLPRHLVADFASPYGVSFVDIGDHDPLSPWLAKFHDTLSEKTGGIIDGIRIVHDIFTMNYALGVVLHPKSTKWKSGQAQEDEWEYRKHFIPMANIITYWVTLETCNYVAAKKFPQAKQLCDTAATKLEFYMGRYWAPKISDFVYEKANGTRVSPRLMLANSEFFFISEPAFEREVRAARL